MKTSGEELAEVRDLLERVEARATNARLAELVGCSREAVRRWGSGTRPGRVLRDRLRQVVEKLRAQAAALERLEESAARPSESRPLPLIANVVAVRVEGGQALLSFSMKIPGEETARPVAEILVPVPVLAAGRILVP